VLQRVSDLLSAMTAKIFIAVIDVGLSKELNPSLM
jgi:hypothetical protein